MKLNQLAIKLMKLRLRLTNIHKRDPYYFTKILKKEGIHVGNNTIFYDPLSQTIDRERPWMIEIGDYCKITKGTIILAHDYSRSVLRRKYGEVIGEAGTTTIGDNVFIGMNSIILMGTHIGNNVIVGAGSVVHGNVPDNCVIAGNPARIIKTLDQHYEDRKGKTVSEAIEYARTFNERYERYPTIREMNAFFSLFMERDIDTLNNSGINLHMNGDNYDEIIEAFMNSKGLFDGYDDFIKEVKKYDI